MSRLREKKNIKDVPVVTVRPHWAAEDSAKGTLRQCILCATSHQLYNNWNPNRGYACQPSSDSVFHVHFPIMTSVELMVENNLSRDGVNIPFSLKTAKPFFNVLFGG